MRRPIPSAGWAAAFAYLLFAAALAAATARADSPFEVITGVVRPLQLASDGRSLFVLSLGARGDSAGEVLRVPLEGGRVPRDLAGHTPIRMPFRGTAWTLGSLAVDPATGALFLGEENGRRIWRLGSDGEVELYATGLRRIAGGSTLGVDHEGRLLVLDYADPFVSPSAERPPPGLEQLREEDYRGPLVLRIAPDATLPLPRHLAHTPPIYPRAWGGRAGGRLLPHFVSLAVLPRGGLALLASSGQLHRLLDDGSLVPFARLPRGQYTRTNMVAAADGTVYVSGGFHVGQVFRIAPDGAVSVVASDLADPAGIAVDAHGTVYVAESSRHRILRLR